MGKQYKVTALPGEGIGPEVVASALQVLEHVAKLERFELDIQIGIIGNEAFKQTGNYFPAETANLCRDSDGILFGSVEKGGLLELRKEFDFFCNLRPVRAYEPILSRSSLKSHHLVGLDILFIRELVSGIYFGEAKRGTDQVGSYGFHTMKYYDEEIRRIARVALTKASERRGVLTVAHKENALPLIPWGEIVLEESLKFSTVRVHPMLVDNLAMQLVMNPSKFDVILAGNLFGDILSDIGGALVGSIGLLASASLNKDGFGMYEAIHGTAPDIAGKDIANPLGTIGAVELMLRQWGLEKAADRLYLAQQHVINQGFRTPDIKTTFTETSVGTAIFTQAIIDSLHQQYSITV